MVNVKENEKKRKMKVNHLRNHYSNFNLAFVKKYVNHLNIEMKIGDIGAGHLRNLKLFQELGFKNLYGVDREDTDNPLSVKVKKFIIQDIENGISFDDKFFDITLCNYVLMFINQSTIFYVLDELMRISNEFLVIETYPKKHNTKKTTFYKDYDFSLIVEYIKSNDEFELLQVRNYYEKLIARRV